MKIREIRETDYEILPYLHWLSLIEEHKELGIDKTVNYLYLKSKWLTEKPKGYLAESHNNIIGFIANEMVYVSPHFMRRGIGTKLLRKAQLATFWVADKNNRAKAFYEANYYMPTSETRTVNKLGYDIKESKWRALSNNACELSPVES